jgi:5-methylcytosine-specific restriction endonuclease McrA
MRRKSRPWGHGCVSWSELRANVLSLNGGYCQRCGITGKLDVHHRVYMPGRKSWQYPIDSLEVLCKSCHGIADGERRRITSLLAQFNWNQREYAETGLQLILDQTREKP